MTEGTATSTVSCSRCVKRESDWDHRDCACECHERPGERERMAFHVHEFEHGCYGKQCLEAYRLYAAWQAALAKSREGRADTPNNQDRPGHRALRRRTR